MRTEELAAGFEAGWRVASELATSEYQLKGELCLGICCVHPLLIQELKRLAFGVLTKRITQVELDNFFEAIYDDEIPIQEYLAAQNGEPPLLEPVEPEAETVDDPFGFSSSWLSTLQSILNNEINVEEVM